METWALGLCRPTGREGRRGQRWGTLSESPPSLSFPVFIPSATPLPRTTKRSAKGHAETGRFLEANFTVQEEEGPHIRPSPSPLAQAAACRS